MRLISPSQRICFLTGLLLTTFTMFQFLRFPLRPIIKRTCGIFTATYMYSKTEGLSHVLCQVSPASSDFLRQMLRSYHFYINLLFCQITVKSQFGSTQFLDKVILISCQLIELNRENWFLISIPSLNGGITWNAKTSAPKLKKRRTGRYSMEPFIIDLYNNVHIVISGVREEVSFAIARG